MSDQNMKNDEDKVQIVDLDALENLLGGGAAAAETAEAGTAQLAIRRDTVMCPW